MKRGNILLLAVAIVAGLSGYGWFAQRQQRARLVVQLLEIQQVLNAENSQRAMRAEGMVKDIEARVMKAQRPPLQVAVLDSCRALRAQTTSLLDTLHRAEDLALSQLGPRFARQPLRAATRLSQPFSAAALAPALARCFAAYQAFLPALRHDSLRVAPPNIDNQPVIMALATIARTETDLLAAEQKLLRRFGRRVGASSLQKNLLAVATAESNTVRPGDTYRARLFVVKQLVLPRTATRMQCNGQPVAVDEHGIGHVRFRASTRPGPASWHGAIRFTINGRDTTFQVRVPYRVAGN